MRQPESEDTVLQVNSRDQKPNAAEDEDKVQLADTETRVAIPMTPTMVRAETAAILLAGEGDSAGEEGEAKEETKTE